MNNNREMDFSDIPRHSTTIVIPEDVQEIEIRKRLSEDVNSSVIWTEFNIREKNNQETSWPITDVWNFPHKGKKRMTHTTKYSEMISSDIEMELVCIHCRQAFPFYKNGSSPLAKEHIEKEHPEFLPLKTPPKKRNYSDISSTNSFNKTANILLASFIVTGKYSFNTLSNEFLQQYSDHLQSSNDKYIVPSRDSMVNKIIPTMTNTVISTIKEELKSVHSICATLDGWSRKIDSDSFLSFTIHYLLNGELKRRVLKLSDDCKCHDSDAISAFIRGVI